MSPVVVVGPQFCAPNETELLITKKITWSSSSPTFNVTDVDGNLMLKVKSGNAFSFSADKRVLADDTGRILISMFPKSFTWHQRWRAYKGDSSKSEDLLFSMKRSGVFQFKTKLLVFLATKATEKACDFMIEVNWSQTACTIYAGDSSTIVAEVKRKTSFKDELQGKDTFRVAVSASVDRAFVVALMIMLIEIDETNANTST